MAPLLQGLLVHSSTVETKDKSKTNYYKRHKCTNAPSHWWFCHSENILEWPTQSGRVAYSAMLAARTVMGSSPKPAPMLADTSAGMWIKKAQLPCWPLYSQQVSHQRWISGIHGTEVTKHVSEGSTLALKPRGDIARSPKQGYQWPHKKDLCPPKFKKRNSRM